MNRESLNQESLYGETDDASWEVLPLGTCHVANLLFGDLAYRTRPIVRLEGGMRMVTKGYQKGVYEWVTKGIRGWNGRGGRVWLYRKDGGKWLYGLSPADC